MALTEIFVMPKTYNNLFNKIISYENLYLAYLDAKKHKKLKAEVLEFGINAESKLMDIHNRLKAGTWQPGHYREFLAKTEVKRRVIHAPDFADRVVHMAVYRVIMPLFEKKYIHDSYACRIGKGTWKATQRLQYFLRVAKRQNQRVYVLKCDISKYYPSIYKPELMAEIARTIRDKHLLKLLESIYYDFNNNQRGIPIGTVTSQLAANIMLNKLDHFVKECIGAKYYLRYMDDFIIIHSDKNRLKEILRDIEWFVSAVLKLRLNPKTGIFPDSQGVDFAGYRTWATHIKPRKRNVKAAKIRFKTLAWHLKHGRITKEAIERRKASFEGYMCHCAGYRTTLSTLRWLDTSQEGG